MGKQTTIVYTCDVCGATIAEGFQYSYAVSYALPGPGYKAITCPDEQHFGCNPDHAAQAAKTCIDHLEKQRQKQRQ